MIIYNDVVARFRRMPHSLVEASMDLATDGFTTFRYIALPQLVTTLLAASVLLAFALCFDELIVSIFTAIPIIAAYYLTYVTESIAGSSR